MEHATVHGDLLGARRMASMLALSLALVAGPPLAAQTLSEEDASSQTKSFDIPAQALPSAIVAFSKVSGVQVLYDSQAAAERRSSAVSGIMSGGQALRDLLIGTGFVVHYAGARAVTLVMPDVKAAASTMHLDTMQVEASPIHIGDSRVFATYADALLASLRGALQGDGSASHAIYTVTIRLWVSAGGQVARSEITQSTGDATLDAAVIKRLATVACQPPPQDLPQPMIFQLWTRSPS
jgi:TonB family protein